MNKIISPLTALLLCWLISFELPGQNTSKLLKKAEKEFYNENFANALGLYNQSLSSEPENQNIKYKVELCSLLVKSYRNRPLNSILEYSRTEGIKDRFYNYWLGKIYFSRYRFEEAVTAFEAFLALDVYKSQELIEITKRLIQNAQSSKLSYNNPQLFEVDRLPDNVNSAESPTTLTYAPAINQLFYTASSSDGNPQLVTLNTENVKPGMPEVIASVTLADNNIDIEYLNPEALLLKHDNRELTYIRYSNNSWSLSEPYNFKLPVKNDKSYFTISEDENTIIFSERDFLGYYDLYQTKRVGSKWSKPEFISNVNSPLDELSPFLSGDGNSLYFSSEGHNSMGGYDVFLSTKSNGSWSAPKNLEYPLNSADNEIHFAPNLDGKSGYLLSDRLNSIGGYDIYSFKEVLFSDVEGTIVDVNTNRVVPGLRVEFHPTNFPTENFVSFSNGIGKYQSRVIAGKNVEVSIYSHENMVHQEIVSLEKESTTTSMTYDFRVSIDLDKNPTLAQSLVNNENSQITDTGYSPIDFIANKFRPGQKAMLKNLYFKFGSSELAAGSDEVVKILIKLMTENPDLQIEIAGHADGIGPSGFNMWLSKKRATAIYQFLTSRGVDGARLFVRGYGESKPIATNDDEINGRSLNRRIEIIVAE